MGAENCILGLNPVRERPLEDKKVVKIRLKKFGTNKRPFYRIVVVDSRKPRQVSIDLDRANYWLSVGAQPSPIVKKIFNTKGLSVAGTAITK